MTSQEIEEVLAGLVHRGVQLWPDGQRLRFRAERGRLADADVAALRANKDGILAVLAGRKAVRLSAVQERLWFLSQLDGSGVGYTFSTVYRIEGPLPVEGFTAALRSALCGEAGLRATFRLLAGRAVQLIRPRLDLDVPLYDWRGVPARTRHRRMRRLLVRPFDLETGPLLRTALFQVADDAHLWGLTLHHLVADGQTIGAIVRRVSRTLAGETAPSGLDHDDHLDYTDYLAWESSRLDSPARRENLEYWAAQLAGAPDLDLPVDRPAAPIRTYAGARTWAQLPAGQVSRLADLARAENTTIFAVLLAVYLAMVSRQSGSEDITVGVPHANRQDRRFQDTAGCFVNTIILRGDLSGDPDFRELVRRVSRTCADAWDHADYSYEELVGRLAPDRDLSQNALFRTFFAFQNVLDELTVPLATTQMVPFDPGTTQFDLELYVLPGRDGGLTCEANYSRALFDRATVRTMVARFVRLAGLLTAAPDRPLSAVADLSSDERAIIGKANDTCAVFPHCGRADLLVLERARQHPERVALTHRGRHLRYGYLARAASALAGRLDGGASQRVGIMLDRSPEAVVAMLAIMGSGTSFVPLDPHLPAARLAWLVADCGIRQVVTAARHAGSVPNGALPVLVDLGDEPGPAGPPAVPPVADASAYVLYTSGSTGAPKGVEVTHGNLVNLLHAMSQRPGIGEPDTFLAVTALSFDISLLELLLPLMHGARLVIATHEEMSDPVLLAALIERWDVTMMQSTPTSWSMLLDSGWPGRRTMTALCGGEPMSRDLADRLLDRCAAVWNLYGPTETTIWSARWRVERTGPVRIGEPIENTRCYVVDAHDRLVPPGTMGELLIGGAGVAEGYVNRPQESARRFVQLPGLDPWRLYRTGDLVRQRRDGTLVFEGRIDHQIKVRGHRVEPEEIEHALRRHPSVLEAIVSVTAASALVCDLVCGPGEPPGFDELREFVASALPAYMVPQHVRYHTAFPTTPSGKVDRRVLAKQPLAATHREGGGPPSGAAEESVATIYRDVLGLGGAIGRHDDFFRLGGHSLLAVQVLHRLRRDHGVDLGLPEFLRDSSVTAVARNVGLAERGRDRENRTIEDALRQIEQMSEAEVEELLARLDEST